MDDISLRLRCENVRAKHVRPVDHRPGRATGGYDKMILCKAVEERICRKIDLASREDLTPEQALDALCLLLKIVRQNGLSVDISSGERLLLSGRF